MPGRPRIPTSLKILHGADKKNPQRFRGKTEPRAPTGLPECPAHLGELAREKWDETVSVLSEMSLLSRAERTVLEQFCIAYENWRQAETRVDMIAWGTLLLKLNNELGLSYVSRSRINLATETKTEGIKQRSRA